MGVSPWALDNSAQTYGQELYVCIMCIKETVVKKTIGESSQRIRIFTSALNQKLSIVQHSKALPLFAFQLYWKMRCQEKISFFD